MSRATARRVKPGDVFELPIDVGFVAVQAIAKHHSHGWAVRVIERDSAAPRADADGIDTQPERYVVLMGNLALEEKEGRLRYVGRAPLPERYRDGLPTFRGSSSYEADGRHERNSWWLDDGQREWFVGELSEAERHYPYRQFTPALALKELIEHGWDPEWEFKGPDARKFTTPLPVRRDMAQNPRFYLIFSRDENAREARDELSSSGIFLSVNVDKVERSHVVVAEAPKSVDLSATEAFLEKIARAHDGEYDGNELPLS